MLYFENSLKINIHGTTITPASALQQLHGRGTFADDLSHENPEVLRHRHALRDGQGFSAELMSQLALELVAASVAK